MTSYKESKTADGKEEQGRKQVSFAVKERLEALEQERKHRKNIFDLQNSLLCVDADSSSESDEKKRRVTVKHLLYCCTFFKPQDYEDAVTERSLGGICGFPLCEAILERKRNPKFKISFKRKELLKDEDFGRFCSGKCRQRSSELSKRLPLPNDLESLEQNVNQAPVIEVPEPALTSVQFPTPGDTESASKVEGFKSNFEPEKSKELLTSEYIQFNFPNSSVPSVTSMRYKKSGSTLISSGLLKFKNSAEAPTAPKKDAETLPKLSASIDKITHDTKKTTQKREADKNNVKQESSLKLEIKAGTAKRNKDALQNEQHDAKGVSSFSLLDFSTIDEDISSVEFTVFMRLWETLNQLLHSLLDDRFDVPRLGDTQPDHFMSRRQIIRGHIHSALDLVRDEITFLDSNFTKAHLLIMVNDTADNFDVSRPIPSMSSREWAILICLLLHKYFSSASDTVAKAETYIQALEGVACSGKTVESSLSPQEYSILLEMVT
uniref:RNA polymerase II subunit B1 CTD phosphatase RPAP2 homolog n=1 Tax=Aplanochytrium stocchinoi TaxID=215587 RepID=A0A6S8G0E3_9STRA|mmetsp:Transcript_10657/g.13345  ORF Transcript_10657/g.13345 Transcript_10657/m.13345 type:complete len:492 (-) Transcript_10657:444-1919(-)|eukprot:CAMPEP_0204822466 /NCGR_PEP_ID=MMETSP1346-20131115/653_1 /ASSEMBLY_ACC=CAM_ASM_000771 /TAXON_ID=215587 /ORGANISM="Aplanochytrium stocchinoi, Strain GSBS06" /LENGTH=491 /DNA_ID=CAMNT_0051948679 /DNA_START=251 /DNA_END=1726 /DNA_ORIENTATION=+